MGKQAPADPILSLTTGFKADTFAQKVNLGVGAYRDNNGKPYVFPVVRKAEKMICEDMSLDKEYAPIDGDADFCRGSRGALFGWDHADVTSGRVAAAGLSVHKYRYFDPKTKGLNINGMLEDLAKAQSGSVVLLHTCAHNPTGVDPTQAQWRQIAEVCAKN